MREAGALAFNRCLIASSSEAADLRQAVPAAARAKDLWQFRIGPDNENAGFARKVALPCHSSDAHGKLRITELKVVPEERRKDVIVMFDSGESHGPA